MGSPGRPTKRTPETVKKLCDAIRLGASYGDACGYAGIDHDTFTRWRQDFPEFAAEVKEAEGSGRVQLIAKIQKAANDGNWQAAAWMLERRDPQNYGRTMRTQVKMAAQVVVVPALASSSDEWASTLAIEAPSDGAD
jgi:transposase